MNKLEAASAALRWSGGGFFLRSMPAWRGLLVLNYHRIGNPAESPYDPDLFSASQDGFDKQIAFLKRNFDVIAPADLPMVRDRGRGRHLMITFDDGYRDNYELAFPVLTAHGIPATFFICTGYIDEPRLPWWDEIAWMIRTTATKSIPASEWWPDELSLESPDRAAAVRAALARYKELPGDQTASFLECLRSMTAVDTGDLNGSDLWMTWEMIRSLHAKGMTIGAHTVRHQLLGRLSESEQSAEIAGSRDRITEEVGTAPSALAYPVGSRAAFTGTTKTLLRQHGFEWAFSFYGGFQQLGSFDPYDIRRAHVGHRGTQPIFEAMTTLPRLFARW